MNCRLFGLLIWASLLAGCASVPSITIGQASAPKNAPNSASQSVNVSEIDRIIAIDLVNVLMQIDGYHPADARLQMEADNVAFKIALRDVLKDAGYQLTTLQQNSIENVVSVTGNATALDTMAQQFIIAVGDVKIRRSYEIARGQLRPASDVFVLGANPAHISLNDDIFNLNHNNLKTVDAPQADPIANAPVSSIDDTAEKVDSAPSLDIRVNGLSTAQTYKVGESINIGISSDKDTSVYCYYQDGTGTVMQMYPNRFNQNAQIKAGQTIKIPASEHWSIEASLPETTEEVMCITNDDTQEDITWLLQSNPDLVPLPVSGFDQLLAELTKVSGIDHLSARVAIHVE